MGSIMSAIPSINGITTIFMISPYLIQANTSDEKLLNPSDGVKAQLLKFSLKFWFYAS